MPDQPLVSILMTSFNREKYIAYAIESVLASTYRNFELIIVDDQSRDRTVEISRSYESKDSRVKVYVNEKNLGDYPNRNRAASYAKGKYIKYIDADDAIYYWGLGVEVEMMERFPGAGYGLDSLGQNDSIQYPYVLDPKDAYREYFINGTELFDKAPTSCIIKREVFLKENGFCELRMVGDTELWHRLSLNYSVVLMPHGIIWSRGHEDSESGALMQDAYTSYHYLSIKKQYLEHPECPLSDAEKNKALRVINRRLSRLLVKSLLRKDITSYRKMKTVSPVSLLDVARNII